MLRTQGPRTNISTNTSNILTLNSAGLLSSSTQIASDISGSWQGQNFISASQTFLSTGQRNGDSGITGSLGVTSYISASGKIYGGLATNVNANTVFYDPAGGELTYGLAPASFTAADISGSWQGYITGSSIVSSSTKSTPSTSLLYATFLQFIVTKNMHITA